MEISLIERWVTDAIKVLGGFITIWTAYVIWTIYNARQQKKKQEEIIELLKKIDEKL
jgi:preprotein translocase subunit YajC